MTRLLIDTSVVIKWFHTAGEDELAPSRAILAAHAREDLTAHVIDLAFYEVGNVLVRALRWDAAAVADQLDDLRVIVGPPILPDGEILREASTLARDHSLSFYDAAWAATARSYELVLVSADRRLQEAGLAESPTRTAKRLRLR